MDLKGKVVLVTGATGGIGTEVVRKFASLGANVMIHYNSSYEKAEKLKNEFINSEAFIVKADLEKEDEIFNMIEETIKKFGKLDILVNNASICDDSLVEDKTKESFSKILNVNLIGTFLTSKYASKYMILNKYGKIINVSSTNGIDTYYPYSLDYDASKAGVISLTHNLALEYAPYINVNCVAPGWVNTKMNENLSPEFKEAELNKIFLKRFAEPSEIASLICFLASDEANYINGEVIRIDGGH